MQLMSRLPILCYHNIAAAPREAPFKLLYVSPDKFERQMWALHGLGLRGVSLAEGLNRLGNSTTGGCIALTFDDGYADTLTMAAPILKHYGFTATCYVVSDAVGTYNRWDSEHLQERKLLMSRPQIEQWLAGGMEVGSHTCSHPRLDELPPNDALAEIAHSRATLREMLGVPVDHFAYPFGHCTVSIAELVRRAGYSSAVTLSPGIASSSDDPHRLPRIFVNGENSWWRCLLHAATPYGRLRQRLHERQRDSRAANPRHAEPC